MNPRQPKDPRDEQRRDQPAGPQDVFDRRTVYGFGSYAPPENRKARRQREREEERARAGKRS
jgi:hypothetical protein